MNQATPEQLLAIAFQLAISNLSGSANMPPSEVEAYIVRSAKEMVKIIGPERVKDKTAKIMRLFE
jgi:hypothetical protein